MFSEFQFASFPVTHRSRAGLLLSVALVVFWSGGVFAASVSTTGSSPAAETSIGFGGAYHVGRWTPMRVISAAGFEAVAAKVVASDADGRPVEFTLAPDERGGFAGLFQSGRLDAPLRITFTDAAGASQQQVEWPGGGKLRPFRQSTDFWMLVGPQPGFELAAQWQNESSPESSRLPAVELLPTPVEELPILAGALDSVSVVVLGDVRLSPQQSAALRRWVETGGRLVVTVGEAAADFAGSPLAEWLPVRIHGTYREEQTDALCSRVAAFIPHNKGGPLLSLDKLEVARLELREGVTLVHGPTAPVVTRSVVGLGIVTVVGLQLNAAPFYSLRAGRAEAEADLASPERRTPAVRVWGGLKFLCQQLALGRSPRSREHAQADPSQLAPTGVTDMQSQLMSVLDEFPEIDRPSSWNVIGLMVLYLLLIGPVDYVVVHRLLRRPHWTWATLPVWVVLASWWSSSFADATNGVSAAAQQLAVLDVGVDTGVQRVSSWCSFYSPQIQRRTVNVRPLWAGAAASTAVRMAPLARPDEGFRGLYRRGGLQLGGAGYALEPGTAAARAIGVPVDQWSSLLFGATAEAEGPPDAPPLAEFRRVVDAHGAIVRVELRHRLPGDLDDWFIVENLEATFPLPGADDKRRLVSGQTYDLTRGCGQRLLRAFIQGQLTSTVQRKTGQETYIRAGVYDPLSRDVDRFFRTLTFHEAVDGSEYTQLSNVPLARLDFSDYIHLGRVIVFGRLSSPVAQFDVEGTLLTSPGGVTYVRLLVPITQQTLNDTP